MVNKDEGVLVFLLLLRAEEGTGECWRSTIATYTAPADLDLLASYTLHNTESQSNLFQYSACAYLESFNADPVICGILHHFGPLRKCLLGRYHISGQTNTYSQRPPKLYPLFEPLKDGGFEPTEMRHALPI